jgi:hypothetical protein
LTLDSIGDFSIYTLTVSGPGIDPFFASRKLRFRLACDDRFDCSQPAAPPPAPAKLPVTIDYMAKDYASFRQALFDFIPTRLPDWTERSEADIGIMLLELFAFTADNLSYLQDRVANEAFLGTATQRRSVAGHLALIGYQMDEGASAHTWLQFQVGSQAALPSDFQVRNKVATGETQIVFEPLGSVTLDPALNQMALYDWGNGTKRGAGRRVRSVVRRRLPAVRQWTRPSRRSAIDGRAAGGGHDRCHVSACEFTARGEFDYDCVLVAGHSSPRELLRVADGSTGESGYSHPWLECVRGFTQPEAGANRPGEHGGRGAACRPKPPTAAVDAVAGAIGPPRSGDVPAGQRSGSARERFCVRVHRTIAAGYQHAPGCSGRRAVAGTADFAG